MFTCDVCQQEFEEARNYFPPDCECFVDGRHYVCVQCWLNITNTFQLKCPFCRINIHAWLHGQLFEKCKTCRGTILKDDLTQHMLTQHPQHLKLIEVVFPDVSYHKEIFYGEQADDEQDMEDRDVDLDETSIYWQVKSNLRTVKFVIDYGKIPEERKGDFKNGNILWFPFIREYCENSLFLHRSEDSMTLRVGHYKSQLSLWHLPEHLFIKSVRDI